MQIMEISLTWDLVLLAAFVLLFSYNFLLGQNATVKLILSIYIAILTADGVANILKTFLFDSAPGFDKLIGTHQEPFFVYLRLGLFLAGIVIFVVKGCFYVELEKHEHVGIRTLIHMIFATLASLLFVATILIYLSGSSFVEGMLLASEIDIYRESSLARVLIDYYQVWFSLPAIAFLVTSFFLEKKPT